MTFDLISSTAVTSYSFNLFLWLFFACLWALEVSKRQESCSHRFAECSADHLQNCFKYQARVWWCAQSWGFVYRELEVVSSTTEVSLSTKNHDSSAGPSWPQEGTDAAWAVSHFPRGKVRLLPRPEMKWGEKCRPRRAEVLILVMTAGKALCCLLVEMHANFLASCLLHSRNIFQAELLLQWLFSFANIMGPHFH